MTRFLPQTPYRLNTIKIGTNFILSYLYSLQTRIIQSKVFKVLALPGILEKFWFPLFSAPDLKQWFPLLFAQNCNTFSVPNFENQSFEGDRGFRVKLSCWPYLKKLFYGGTEAFNRNKIFDSIRKLLHFENRNFGRISYKKMRKILIFGYFR